MIRITKPDPPEILSNKGADEHAKMCCEYDADPHAYISGKKTFTFKDTIYADPSVKQSLIKAQHKKCCFCEAKVGEDGDIEHYRPKATSRQSENSKLIKPGYYWLAYDWDNLFLCCKPCNQQFKKNLFPLSDPTKRALSHNDDIRNEEPLFIHPVNHDPEEHIGFRREIPYPINNSKLGSETIRALALDRTDINERRRDRLKLLDALLQIVVNSQRKSNDITIAINLLKLAVQDDSEYASMVRCNLGNLIRHL